MHRFHSPAFLAYAMIDPDLYPHHAIVANHGEERLLIHSPTLAGLYTECGRAMARLHGVAAPAPGEAEWRPVEVIGADSAMLLVEWINELILRAERERWVPTEFRADLVAPTRLRIWGRGPTLDAPPSRVKGAARLGPQVTRHDAGYRGEVVLDG